MAPLWPTIERVVAAELRSRAWQLATEGAEATLNTLHPRIRWRDGALEVHAPGDADIDLAGRGLVLMPSVWTRPAVAIGWKQPTVIYPLRSSSWAQEDPGGDCHDGLAGVLGITRARVLRALVSEHTTSELARALRISPASASTHAAALRRAGLVTTRREGKAVRHALTELGEAVVTATPGGIDPASAATPLFPAQHRPQCVEDGGVVDGGRDRLVGTVGDPTHGLAQDLPRPGLGQRRYDGDVLERSDGADLVAHHLHQLGGELCLVALDAGLEHDEPARDLPLHRVGDSDHGALSDVGV